jgi:hypothetical protein
MPKGMRAQITKKKPYSLFSRAKEHKHNSVRVIKSNQPSAVKKKKKKKKKRKKKKGRGNYSGSLLSNALIIQFIFSSFHSPTNTDLSIDDRRLFVLFTNFLSVWSIDCLGPYKFQPFFEIIVQIDKLRIPWIFLMNLLKEKGISYHKGYEVIMGTQKSHKYYIIDNKRKRKK